MEPAYLGLLESIFEVCIVPLLGVLTAYAVAFLKAKKEEILAKIATNRTQEEKELASKYLSMPRPVVVGTSI